MKVFNFITSNFSLELTSSYSTVHSYLKFFGVNLTTVNFSLSLNLFSHYQF